MSKNKNLILTVQGGAGDVLSHTPMIRHFRNKYQDANIIVISTYHHLLENNPNIDELIPFSEIHDIYSEHIHNKEIYFYKKHFVYDGFLDTPRKSSKNLLEFVCKMYGAEWDNNGPDYFILPREERFANTFMSQFDKPIILLHTTGSIPSENPLNMHKAGDVKDISPDMLAEVVKKFNDRYYFLQIGLQGEQLVPGALDGLGMKMRETISIIPHCASFIFIESLFAHCSAALNKSGVVLFNNTDPNFFGYPHNINVDCSPKCNYWPCNRPLGALLDLAPGFINPKTRERILWRCEKRVCQKHNPEIVSAALKASLKEPKGIKKKINRKNFQEVKKEK